MSLDLNNIFALETYSYADIWNLFKEKEKRLSLIPDTITEYQKNKLKNYEIDEYYRRLKQITHIKFSGMVTNVNLIKGAYDDSYKCKLEVHITEDDTDNGLICYLYATNFISAISTQRLADTLSKNDHVVCSANLKDKHNNHHKAANSQWCPSVFTVSSITIL